MKSIQNILQIFPLKQHLIRLIFNILKEFIHAPFPTLNNTCKNFCILNTVIINNLSFTKLINFERKSQTIFRISLKVSNFPTKF